MAERETSPEDSDEARPVQKSKRNRVKEGTTTTTLKPTDEALIGKLNTL